jgi:hypothetical protein
MLDTAHWARLASTYCQQREMGMLLCSNLLLTRPGIRFAAHLEMVCCHGTQLLHCWVRHLVAQAGSKGGS